VQTGIQLRAVLLLALNFRFAVRPSITKPSVLPAIFHCTPKDFAFNSCYPLYCLQWRNRHFLVSMCDSLSSDFPTLLWKEENNVFYRNWNKWTLNMTVHLYLLPSIRMRTVLLHSSICIHDVVFQSQENIFKGKCSSKMWRRQAVVSTVMKLRIP
jgi:hypothetical protein